jgi:hypothetical protein
LTLEGELEARPAQLAALSLPSLKTVKGLSKVFLRLRGSEGNREQVVNDTAKLAEGILQWAHKLHLVCHDNQAVTVLPDVMAALHRWQPVHSWRRCELTIEWDVSPMRQALANLPPCVQSLK